VGFILFISPLIFYLSQKIKSGGMGRIKAHPKVNHCHSFIWDEVVLGPLSPSHALSLHIASLLCFEAKYGGGGKVKQRETVDNFPKSQRKKRVAVVNVPSFLALFGQFFVLRAKYGPLYFQGQIIRPISPRNKKNVAKLIKR